MVCTDVGEVFETTNPIFSSNYLKNILDERVNISGGGDCPEKSITAMVKALEAINYNSYVILFTDASPKDSSIVGRAFNLIQEKKSRVIKIKNSIVLGIMKILPTEKKFET